MVTFTELILIANVIKCRQTVNVDDYEYGDVLTVPKFIGKTVPIRDWWMTQISWGHFLRINFRNLRWHCVWSAMFVNDKKTIWKEIWPPRPQHWFWRLGPNFPKQEIWRFWDPKSVFFTFWNTLLKGFHQKHPKKHLFCEKRWKKWNISNFLSPLYCIFKKYFFEKHCSRSLRARNS